MTNRILTIAFAGAIAAAGAAQTQSKTADVLYAPARDTKDQGISLRSWGSGTISQTDEAAYEGVHSLRVSTRSFFQGGSLTYATPADLSGRYSDKNNLLKITMKTAGSGALGFSGGPSGPSGKLGGLAGAGGAAGGIGGPGGGPPPGFGGRAGFPGGFPGQGGFGGPGAFGGPGGGVPGAPTTTSLQTIRMIVTTTDNKKSEVYIPINTSTSQDRGWKILAIPLQAISGFDRTNKIVKDISFSGDETSTFYVGDLRVINDSTPITGEILQASDINLANGDTYTFRASGSGGSSILKYSWNFDSEHQTDTDASGQTVARKFRKAGKYRVTLTVSDLYGLKAPYSTSMNVTVNP